MNQFDVPMSDADINMTSNPARAMLDEKLATTGESNGWFWTALGIGASIYGSSKQASAARSEAEARNQAIERQYEYDMELYDMKKQQLQANQDFKIEEIQNAARQEGQIAAFKDASNLRQYNYNLQIRNAQQETNEKMFQKSEKIYENQLSMNALQEKAAYDDELRKLDEIKAESIFDQEDAYIDSIEAEGKLRARGVVGRSADKLAQAAAFKTGKQLTMLNLSVDNAEAAAASVLSQISRDKTVADLNAFAAKMLDPGELPMPVQPLKTPMATFIYPRPLQDFDFGPEPVKGAQYSAASATAGIWGNAIAGLAGQIGNYYANQSQPFKV